MAIVILARNGIGLGHFSRASAIAAFMHSKGEDPVLFYQTDLRAPDTSFYAASIRDIRKNRSVYKQQISSIINDACRISSPSVFIEDTHPLDLTLSKEIYKILIVRPTTFAYLITINKEYGKQYALFAISDDPASPTWPYNEEETEIILSWPKWIVIGPIFRKYTDNDLDQVKKKYNYDAQHPIFLFSMGGGGQQRDGNDFEYFRNESIALREEIRTHHPDARFVFVKGPLFRSDHELPPGFEIFDHEEQMPALFAIAEGAVIRPGFNSVWECISGLTPFYAIQGTTYNEPIDDKLKRLKDFDLYSDNNILLSAEARKRFMRQGALMKDRYSGHPSNALIEAITALKPDLGQQSPSLHFSEDSVHRERKTPTASPNQCRFFIRVDDITDLDNGLIRIINALKYFSLSCTFEIIPYFNRIPGKALDKYFSNDDHFAVAQHGYTHIRKLSSSPYKSEFDLLENTGDIDNLRKGKSLMEKAFGKYFKQGFSAPYDLLPEWLIPHWLDMGGNYFTSIAQKKDSPGSFVDGLIDIWNWNRDCFRSRDVILNAIEGQCSTNNTIGLIVHPRHINDPVSLRFLNELLEHVSGLGFDRFTFDL